MRRYQFGYEFLDGLSIKGREMTLRLDKIFYIYTAAVGLFTSLLLVYVLASQDFVIPPFFWIVLAIGLFDVGNTFVPRGGPMPMLTNLTRGIGLAIGLIAMWAVTAYAGAPVRFI